MTLRAMRRERRPTRVMLLVDLDSRGVPGPRAVRRCGYAVQFSTCRVLFQERAIVLFYTWLLLYQPVVGLLSRRLPASHFVRSLTWSISDVKHGSGCGGRDPLRPMPAHEDHQGQGRAPTNSSAPCWQLRYMSVFSRHWYIAAARACRADHCEAGGNHFVQFLRRVWQLQYMSASQRGCTATASSAVQITAEWRWLHRPPGPSTFRPGRRSPCRV